VTDQELRELLALSAVGALTQEEQMELDAEIADRPDLRAELVELQSIAATMAEAVAEPPPPGLKASVLAAIAETPQVEAERPVAPVVPIDSRRRRNRWLGVGAAAAAVVALAVGALIVLPSDEGDDEIAAVVDAEDAVEIPMPGELPGVTIVYSAEEDAAVLLAEQVPVPEGDNVYELWAIRGGTPESFATFRPDDEGRLSVYAAGLDPASADEWAITEEQAGGSPTGQPTTDILAATA
jgi:anti-sigma-K factor RskA